MDIFIIKTAEADKINDDLLKEFQRKNITYKTSLKEHSLMYLMLDRILKEVYKINNPKIEFINEKPYLNNNEKYISLSHSKDYILIGISDFECGIDIEYMKPRNYTKISKRMKFKCNTIEEFYFCWTKYEAKYKLNQEYKSINQTKFENYAITTLSSNPEEKFEIYYQN